MAIKILAALCLLSMLLLRCSSAEEEEAVTCSGIVPMRGRAEVISITDFGGVGDGLTLNTAAFQAAIFRISHLRRRGGTLLYIPAGVWLTGSFDLTSHMTLYLAKGAVIKATQVGEIINCFSFSFLPTLHANIIQYFDENSEFL